jgi:2',3'-cyclic-nucleotide 2'-phosphodiesterase (5'-nucleotidase family)
MKSWLKWGTLVLSLSVSMSCSRIYHLAGNQVTTYRITEKISENAENNPVEQMIKPYRQSLSSEMSQVIALASQPLERGARSAPESTMGNWVADAILAQTKLMTRRDIDFAVCNKGGLRIPALPAGPITRGHFYELMPFDNYLVTMKLPGTLVRKLFDNMASDDGWPISAGVSYQIKDGKAQNIIIKGKPLNESETYELALSDYLAEGGNNCSFLVDFPSQNLGIYYRDALIEYATMQHAISRSLDARIEGRVVSLDQ